VKTYRVKALDAKREQVGETTIRLHEQFDRALVVVVEADHPVSPAALSSISAAVGKITSRPVFAIIGKGVTLCEVEEVECAGTS